MTGNKFIHDNNYDMQKLIIIPAVFFLAGLAISCGSSSREKGNHPEELKAKLEKLRDEKNKLDVQIHQVEKKLAEVDSSFGQVSKLVSVDTVTATDFRHFIELQGRIDAENVAYVSPAGQGGVVKQVFVKTGSQVRKGQPILKLDDALASQALVGARQQAAVLEARLSQAQTIYERYQNLWKQNIGTEINVINARAEVDALQSQLKAAQAQVNMAREQVNQTVVTAGITGMIVQVNIKVGEFFTPMSAADPRFGIRIVNNNQIKAVAEVPENYASRVKKGYPVEVHVPESGKPAFKSAVSVVGAAVNPTTRSFIAEAKLPADPVLKPNQLATFRILDYEAKNVVAVSVNFIQTDETGKYVFVAEKQAGKILARKKPVVVGESYGGMIEIKSGLNSGDAVITEGYQTVYDGQVIKPLAG